jgi:hypothetical protein
MFLGGICQFFYNLPSLIIGRWTGINIKIPFAFRFHRWNLSVVGHSERQKVRRHWHGRLKMIPEEILHADPYKNNNLKFEANR